MLHVSMNTAVRTPRGASLPILRSRMLPTSAGIVDISETGPVGGPAIILVTHGLGSLESFEEIALSLAVRLPRHRIVTYSRPGTGMTPWPSHLEAGGQFVWEASVALPAMLDALDIRTADIIGHSDGAVVAMLAARIHPERVRSLIAMAPQIFADAQFIQATRNLPAEEPRTGLLNQLCAIHADEALVYRRWRAAREALCRMPEALLDHIDGLRTPVLFVQGLRDEFGSSNQVSLAAGRVAGPVKWVLLQRDGHFPQHDNPEQILALIENHLGSCESPMAGRRAVSSAVRHA